MPDVQTWNGELRLETGPAGNRLPSPRLLLIVMPCHISQAFQKCQDEFWSCLGLPVPFVFPRYSLHHCTDCYTLHRQLPRDLPGGGPADPAVRLLPGVSAPGTAAVLCTALHSTAGGRAQGFEGGRALRPGLSRSLEIILEYFVRIYRCDHVW